jgi:hypothetical protein
MDPAAQQSPSGFADEKPIFNHEAVAREETAHEAAEQGVAATDK